VPERGNGLSLDLEAPQERLVLRQRRMEHLEGHTPLQPDVLRHEHMC
jgi:hypothetical protein